MKIQNIKYLTRFAVILGSIAAVSAVQAETFTSGSTKNTLIELYTSQGCSSCPPAEKYLNSLKDDPKLWKTYFPIALHVDYWDYIGWKDKFASPVHTQRQREYARVNNQKTIYTPGFFVNGAPWRRGFFGSNPEVSKKEVGHLSLQLEGNNISADFSGVKGSANQTLTLTVAVVGMSLKVDIKAGEREDSSANHSFVNLKYVSQDASDGKWTMTLPSYNRKGAKQLAIVAWVSKKDDPRPIQAVGGYINN